MQVFFFCPECGEGPETEVRQADQTITVRGEQIEVKANVRYCVVCGAEVADQELDDATLEAAYAEYRKRHNLLSGSDIQAIRTNLGLSQRGLAQLLGWGLITIHRYESGATPSEAHNQVLKSLRDPVSVRVLLDQNPGRVSPSVEKKLRARLRVLLDSSTGERIAREIGRALEDQAVSEFTGYRQFDFERLANMVSFFAVRSQDLFKTKLMKLLWYSDFLYFKENTVGISGAAYAHLPNGPALDHWQSLIAGLVERKVIDIFLEGGHNWEGERIVPLIEADLSLFTNKELDMLQSVADLLGNKSAKELSDLSHSEQAYSQTENGQLISYKRALSLTGIHV